MQQEYIYKKINHIVFGILSPKSIKKMACTKIVTAELYDKEGYPVDGGLMDIRLGVIDPGLRCKTCGGKLKECVGHFGYIELARPIIHIKYMKIIYELLQSICRECSRIMLEDPKIDEYIQLLDKIEKEKGSLQKKKKIKEIVTYLRKVTKCPHCKAKQIKIKIEKPYSLYEKDKRLTPLDIRAKFEKIPDKDIELFGINPTHARPEWTILTVLPIPPVTMRPSITLENGERSEDDLTHKLGDIVRINQRLFENINAGAPEIIVEDLWDLLQYHITTYIDNTITQIPPARHRSGQLLKTLSERIKSKEGRFRHNLVGKRVNFAARTVISPDPKIKINEVGIPLEVAKELTIPEKVTEWNLEYCKNLVKNGPHKYPGANYVIKGGIKKKQITADTQEQLYNELEPGDVVERHAIDGDISLFNRQPSLHRMSIMSHKIKVLPGKSFRLNPAVTAPYNADFDGDEMNLHLPQTEEARAEADILMQVQTQIITPKNGSNIMGCMEDSITGNYLLTKHLSFTKEKAIEILGHIGMEEFPSLKESVTGKELFSALLPNDFDFYGESKNNEEIIVRKGKLISGTIDEATIGETDGTLLRAIFKKYGPEACARVLTNTFRLGIAVLLEEGFTTSLKDSDLPESIKEKVQTVVNDAKKVVDSLIRRYHDKQLDVLPGKTLKETLEIEILRELNTVRNRVGSIIKESASEFNPTIMMARSGAKGNILNLAQIAACIGQQALRGARIKEGYLKRTLSVFKKNDLSPKARGFIESSFKSGLGPVEFFFGAITGRDSLMDTALRTPKSGYLYRRLANALQDLKIEYDETVRDANKTILQFTYGEDGVEVSKSEKGIIDIKSIIKQVKGE